MISRAILSVFFCFACGNVRATPIPETISTGSYSVTMKLSEEACAVEVLEKSESIRYSYAFPQDKTGDYFQITVRRVELPAAKLNLPTGDLVSHLIQDDGLKFKWAEYRRGFRFTFHPDITRCPAGTAYIYTTDRWSFNPKARYPAVALLLPDDYRTRKVGYLVCGDEIGLTMSAAFTQPQRLFIDRILQGLRETVPAKESPKKAD